MFCLFNKAFSKLTLPSFFFISGRYSHLSQTSFPVLTTCPTHPYHLERLQANGVPTKSAIQFQAQWVSNDSKVTPEDFYRDVVLAKEEIIAQVSQTLLLPATGKS